MTRNAEVMFCCRAGDELLINASPWSDCTEPLRAVRLIQAQPSLGSKLFDADHPDCSMPESGLTSQLETVLNLRTKN